MKGERIKEIVDRISTGLSYVQAEPIAREGLRLATALTVVVDELNDEIEALKAKVDELTAKVAP